MQPDDVSVDDLVSFAVMRRIPIVIKDAVAKAIQPVILGQPISIEYKHRTETFVFALSVKQCPIGCNAKVSREVHSASTRGCMSEQAFP
jgi:hypothetical protein